MGSQVFEHIIYEVERGRARITLNRPEKRNALSIELVEELRTALWEADDDKAVHCVILKVPAALFVQATTSRHRVQLRMTGLIVAKAGASMMTLGISSGSSGACGP